MLEKPGRNFMPLLLGLVLVGGVLAAGWWWRERLLSLVEKAEETAAQHDPNQPPPERATIKTVLDAITVELDTGHVIRYIGVRTPSVVEEVQCFGKEALLANESVIGKEVRLEEEPLLRRAQDGAWTRYVFLLPEAKGNDQTPMPNDQVNPNDQNLNNESEGSENSELEISSQPSPSAEGGETVEVIPTPTANEAPEATDPTEEFADSSSSPADSSQNDSEMGEEIFINERILEGGFGFPIVSEDMKYGERLLSAARFSSATGKGLWSRCEITGEAPQLTTQAQTDCVIKGKVTSDFKKIYRTPECSAYAQMVVLESQGGRWFCAEDIAQDAGFVKAEDCS